MGPNRLGVQSHESTRALQRTEELVVAPGDAWGGLKQRNGGIRTAETPLDRGHHSCEHQVTRVTQQVGRRLAAPGGQPDGGGRRGGSGHTRYP